MFVIFSGSSGVGKNTVINELMKNNKNIKFFVSCTTRDIRPGEVKDVNYHYFTKEEFLKMYDNHELAEYEEIHGNYYGARIEDVLSAVDSCDVVIKDMGVEGNKNMRSVLGKGKVLSIFIDAPKDVLLERLRGRGDAEENIQLRMKRYDYEHTFMNDYDFIVQNDKVEDCAEKIQKIIDDFKKKDNNQGLNSENGKKC